MKKPITVKPYLSVETVETRYRQAKDPVERSQWQIIWRLSQGKTTKAIREVTGYCLAWIRTIAHRYNQDGPAGIGDRRHGNPGGSFLLSAQLQTQLVAALEEPPPDGGSGPVAKWPSGSWSRLRAKCILSAAGSISNAWARAARVLRPRHAKADAAAQEAFKKR